MEQVIRETEMVPQGDPAQLPAAPPEVQGRYVKPGTAVAVGTKHAIEEGVLTSAFFVVFVFVQITSTRLS